MWGLYKSKNINVQYCSNFRNVCLTDGALNVVRLMHCEVCRTVLFPVKILTLIWRTKSSEMLCYVLTGEQILAVWRSVLPASSGSSSVFLHCWTLMKAGACCSKTLVTVYHSAGLYIPEGLLWKQQISNVLVYFLVVILSVINISWSEVLYIHHVLPCSIKRQHVHEYVLDTKRRCFTLWVTGLVFKF
jgi:hypothetical protein